MASPYGYGSTRPTAQGPRGRTNPQQNTPGGGDQGNVLRRQQPSVPGRQVGSAAAPMRTPGAGAGSPSPGIPTGVPASPVLPNGQLQPQQLVVRGADGGGDRPGGAPASPAPPPAPGPDWVATGAGGWIPPNHPNVLEGRHRALLDSILANPQILGPEEIAGMRGQAQDDLTSILGQLEDQIQQDAASRGTLGGGTTAGMVSDARTGMAANLFNTFRDIEVEAAQTNRDSELDALSAAQAFEQLQLQEALGMGGLDIDRQRLGESGRQFDLGHQLAWAHLMNQMVMGRLGYGLDLAQFEQGGNLDWLMALLGGLQ